MRSRYTHRVATLNIRVAMTLSCMLVYATAVVSVVAKADVVAVSTDRIYVY